MLSALDRLLYRSLLPLCARLDARRALRVLLSGLPRASGAADRAADRSAAAGRAHGAPALAHGLLRELLGGDPAGWYVPPGAGVGPSALALLRREFRCAPRRAPGESALAQSAGLWLLRFLTKRLQWGFHAGMVLAHERLNRMPGGGPPRSLPPPDGRTERATLAPGSGLLLLSHPLLTPPFERSVVLLLEHARPLAGAAAAPGHDDDGSAAGSSSSSSRERASLGVVINASAPLCTLRDAAALGDFIVSAPPPPPPLAGGAPHSSGIGGGGDGSSCSGGGGGGGDGGGRGAATGARRSSSLAAAATDAPPLPVRGVLPPPLLLPPPPAADHPATSSSLLSSAPLSARGLSLALLELASAGRPAHEVGRLRGQRRRQQQQERERCASDQSQLCDDGERVEVAAPEPAAQAVGGRRRVRRPVLQSPPAGGSGGPAASVGEAGGSQLAGRSAAAAAAAVLVGGRNVLAVGGRELQPQQQPWAVSPLLTAAAPVVQPAAASASSEVITVASSIDLAPHLPDFVTLPFAVTAPTELSRDALADMFPPPSPLQLLWRGVAGRWATASPRDTRRGRVIHAHFAPLRVGTGGAAAAPGVGAAGSSGSEPNLVEQPVVAVPRSLLAWPFQAGDRLQLVYDSSGGGGAEGAVDVDDGTIIRDAVTPAWLEGSSDDDDDDSDDDDADDDEEEERALGEGRQVGGDARSHDDDDLLPHLSPRAAMLRYAGRRATSSSGSGFAGGGAWYGQSMMSRGSSSGATLSSQRSPRRRRSLSESAGGAQLLARSSWTHGGFPIHDGAALTSAAHLADVSAPAANGGLAGLAALVGPRHGDDDDSEDDDGSDDEASVGNGGFVRAGSGRHPADGSADDGFSPFGDPEDEHPASDWLPASAASAHTLTGLGSGVGAPLLIRFQSRAGGPSATALLFPHHVRHLARILAEKRRELSRASSVTSAGGAIELSAPSAGTVPPREMVVGTHAPADDADDDDDDDEDLERFHVSVQLVRFPPRTPAGAHRWSLVFSHELHDAPNIPRLRQPLRGREPRVSSGARSTGQQASYSGLLALEVPLAGGSPATVAGVEGEPRAAATSAVAESPRSLRVHMLGSARNMPPHVARQTATALIKAWAARALRGSNNEGVRPTWQVHPDSAAIERALSSCARTTAPLRSAGAATPAGNGSSSTPSPGGRGADAGATALRVFGDCPVFEGGPVPGFALAATTLSELADCALEVALPSLGSGVRSGGGGGEGSEDGGGTSARHQPSVWVTRSLVGAGRLAALGLLDAPPPAGPAAAAAAAAAAAPPPSALLFLKNASVWAPGQLEAEVRGGAWIVVAHDDVGALLRQQASSGPGSGEAMWRALLESLGGEFASLASVPPGTLARLPGATSEPADML